MSISRRYDRGMTTKIAVSLPDHLVEAARAAVREGRATSVSAYIAAAIERQLVSDDLGTLLADLDAELGHASAEDLAWADAALGLP